MNNFWKLTVGSIKGEYPEDKNKFETYALKNGYAIAGELTKTKGDSLNFSSISLFVANLIQMCFIGKFVVNRIPFDR